MSETWRPWPSDTGVEASNLGRIRSAGRILTPRASMAYVPGSVKSSMYPKVRVRRPDGTRWWVAVHRIVCDAWLGRCPDGWHRAHLNGDVRDNRLVNLAIVPARVNMVEHRVSQGHDPIYKLSEEQLQEALAMYAKPGVSCRDVERHFKLSAGGFHYHAERMGVLKPHGGKLTADQRAEAVARIKGGETVRSVARAMGMTENGLATSLRATGELAMPTPRRRVELLDDTRAAIRAERERGDRLVEIAARHGVGLGTVQAIVGRSRLQRGKHVGERGEEMAQAAKRMTAREFAEAFSVPLATAKYHIRMARHDSSKNAA